MSKSSATYEQQFDQIKRSYPAFITDLTMDKLQSRGVLEDWLEKHRRRIATEKLDEWYKFAKRVADLQGVILTIRENDTKAEIVELDRQGLAETRADEAKTAAAKRRAEQSDAERRVRENELAMKAAHDKHEMEMEEQRLKLKEKQLTIEKSILENEALKRKLEQDRAQTKAQGVESEINSIIQKVQQIGQVKETEAYLKKIYPERLWKDIEALCERRKGEILREGRG